LEHCWKTDRASRPSVKDVSTCVKSAASTCGILSPAGDTPQRHEEPDSGLFKFDHLFSDGDGIGATPIGRPSSEDSTLTDISLPDSIFSSNVSETATHITEPSRISIEGWVSESKGEGTGGTPDVTFEPVINDTHPISRPSTPCSVSKAQLRPSDGNPSPYRDSIFVHSNGSSRTTINGVTSTQGEDPRPGAATPDEGETCPEKPSAVGDPVDSSFLFLPGEKADGETRARNGSMPQSRKPPGMFTLFSPKPRSIEADIDDRVKQKPRQSRFHIRQWHGIIPPGEAHM